MCDLSVICKYNIFTHLSFSKEMKETGRTHEILERIGYVFYCIVLSVLVLIALQVLVTTIRIETISVGRIKLHTALFVGFAAFFLLFLIPRVRENTRWMMKFIHEFTHLVFALLFFRKIRRFNVDDKDSHVSYSGGWFGYFPITISPYCVPLLTLALLPWRYTTGDDFFLLVIDFFIGMSYAFHVCCWVSQIRLYQPDITGPGTVKSLLAVTWLQILNFCLVLLTPSSGVILALKRVFVDFPLGVFSFFFPLER